MNTDRHPWETLANSPASATLLLILLFLILVLFLCSNHSIERKRTPTRLGLFWFVRNWVKRREIHA